MLEQMSQRLNACNTFEAAVATILADIVALHGAEFGNLQLVDEDRLVIVAERGLEAPFLLAFREVRKSDGCACGRAWRAGEPTIVENVEADEAYAPFVEIARETGYRGVQSTPLVSTDGKAVGMVSTLFANPHVPTSIEMSTCKTYCRVAADHLKALLDGSSIGAKARQLHETLFAELARHPDPMAQPASLAR